jgi:hypothetical protein
MNLSALNWSAGAIVLPLFLNILHGAAPVSAEQINRSKQIDRANNSTVIDLNLTIPPDAKIAIDRRSNVKSSLHASSRVTTASPNRNSALKPPSNLTKQRMSPLVMPVIAVDSEAVALKSDRQNIVVTAVNPTPTATKDTPRTKTNAKQKSGKLSRSSIGGNYLRLVRDPHRGTNSLGNPIYTLETYINGQLDRRFKAVSGTARSQQADRHIGDNHAPLPDGMYAVSHWITLSNIQEVDRTFISITPKFQTNRTELGIHLDPSFDRPNGYDGTSGCIGMTTDEDRDAINNFVTKYRPNKLLVKILPTK